jgi:hypothetical protein
MGSYLAMEPEPVRLKRAAKIMRQKTAQARTCMFEPLSAPVRIAVETVKRRDPADRARQRDIRQSARAIEAENIKNQMAVSEAAKRLIAAIRTAENILTQTPEFLLEDGLCHLDDDGSAFDPLFVTYRDGRPVPRLTRMFAGWTDNRGGLGEVSAFVAAIKTHPAEAARFAIVTEARERYRAAMRRLRDRDAETAQGRI